MSKLVEVAHGPWDLGEKEVPNDRVLPDDNINTVIGTGTAPSSSSDNNIVEVVGTNNDDAAQDFSKMTEDQQLEYVLKMSEKEASGSRGGGLKGGAQQGANKKMSSEEVLKCTRFSFFNAFSPRGS